MITNIDFVGFEDEFQTILASLLNGPEELDVVSLVGMPGNGKTTLAQKLYQDPSVRIHFDIRAWCVVSQLYRKRELWHNLLCQLDHRCREMDDVDEDGIAEKIAQNLRRRRYLIIVDDIWEIKAWSDLRRYLPNDSNGSRILITTRHQDVAKQTSLIPCNVHRFRLFTELESYELLERKSGLKDFHSEELKQVGRRIALSCKGLPLAIVIVAGHLAKAEKNVEKWKKFLEGLSSSILNDKERPYRVMLEWSYTCLPDPLKPCFLYVGLLAAYEPVRFSDLKLLWIAEGFVCDYKFEDSEKLANEYVKDLIDRSLVIPTRERTVGGVKELQMHDLLKDFCLELSEEQNFMHKIEDETNGTQKVSFWMGRYDFQISIPSGSSSGSRRCLRSLIRFPFGSFVKDALPPFNSMDFKLLEVLDMRGGSQNGDIFDSIQYLTHLKYLAFLTPYSASHSPSYHIPSSIVSLRSLRTFILVNKLKEVSVPDSLLDMENLRNVHIRGGHVRFQVESSRPEKPSLSENIETLSTPFFSSTSDAEMLRRMPMLRKLSFNYGFCQIPSLDFLTQLVSLKISGDFSYGVRHDNLNFPSSLNKLSLGDCLISWDEISKLGRKLPNLEVLKLGLTGDGETWTVMAGDFPNLRYLKIKMNRFITEWIASEESFAKLEQLHLEYLSKLEEIPCCLNDAICLRMITVKHCGRDSLYDSATRIEKVQKEELLNEEFVANVSMRSSPLAEAFIQRFEEIVEQMLNELLLPTMYVDQ